MVLGAVAACVAYAVLRLWDARGEGDVILLTASVPYYWRAAASGVIGVVAGLLAGFGLAEGQAARVLAGRWWLWGVLAAAVAVVWVP